MKRVQGGFREQALGKSTSGKSLRTDAFFELDGARYRLLTPLGRGAHCVVWRCQISPGTACSRDGDSRPPFLALKVHTSTCDGGRQAQREADALRALAIT